MDNLDESFFKKKSISEYGRGQHNSVKQLSSNYKKSVSESSLGGGGSHNSRLRKYYRKYTDTWCSVMYWESPWNAEGTWEAGQGSRIQAAKGLICHEPRWNASQGAGGNVALDWWTVDNGRATRVIKQTNVSLISRKGSLTPQNNGSLVKF